MSFRERWIKKFVESLIKDEKKALRLWLDFSERKGTWMWGSVHIQQHRSFIRTPSNRPPEKSNNSFQEWQS